MIDLLGINKESKDFMKPPRARSNINYQNKEGISTKDMNDGSLNNFISNFVSKDNAYIGKSIISNK